MSCDVGKATEGLEKICDVGEVTESDRMSCDVGKATEGLENELSRR